MRSGLHFAGNIVICKHFQGTKYNFVYITLFEHPENTMQINFTAIEVFGLTRYPDIPFMLKPNVIRLNFEENKYKFLYITLFDQQKLTIGTNFTRYRSVWINEISLSYKLTNICLLTFDISQGLIINRRVVISYIFHVFHH